MKQWITEQTTVLTMLIGEAREGKDNWEDGDRWRLVRLLIGSQWGVDKVVIRRRD